MLRVPPLGDVDDPIMLSCLLRRHMAFTSCGAAMSERPGICPRTVLTATVAAKTITTMQLSLGLEMKILSLILSMFLVGCVADPEKLDAVAKDESSRLAKPSKPFSAFSSYELKPFVYSAQVKNSRGKVKQAVILEQKVKEKLSALFLNWSSQNRAGRSGKLIVQPELVSLRIVSGGARFWVGAFAGQSSIDVDLRLIDGSTNKVIGKPRITRNAGAMTGAWSIGQSDKNLHDYIAHIIHQYFSSNFSQGGPVEPVAGSPMPTVTSFAPSATATNDSVADLAP